MFKLGITQLAAIAGLVSAGPLWAQALTSPPSASPPVPGAAAVLNPEFLLAKGKAAIAGAKGKPLPKGVTKDASGNVYVNGKVNGDLVVVTAPSTGGPK